MVCMGNICRSPTAEAVLSHTIRQKKLHQQIEVHSAGTASYHIGESPDKRSTKVASKRGYNLSTITARQVQLSDFYEYNYIMAMDNDNFQILASMQPVDSTAKLFKFLKFSTQNKYEYVPDPYYAGGDKGFEIVLDLIENASNGFLSYLDKNNT